VGERKGVMRVAWVNGTLEGASRARCGVDTGPPRVLATAAFNRSRRMVERPGESLPPPGAAAGIAPAGFGKPRLLAIMVPQRMRIVSPSSN